MFRTVTTQYAMHNPHIFASILPKMLSHSFLFITYR